MPHRLRAGVKKMAAHVQPHKPSQLTGARSARASKRSPSRTTAMSKRTREKKGAKSQQPAKPDAISIGRRFAQPYGKARLLIDHPHSYREWNIVGQCDVPGFFYLESRFRLNPGEVPASYTAFELCLHESQFERVQV
jgi:hypothetical protein